MNPWVKIALFTACVVGPPGAWWGFVRLKKAVARQFYVGNHRLCTYCVTRHRAVR